MNEDLLYQIALTLVPNIGDVRAKSLIEKFGDARSIFRAKDHQLENIEGIGSLAISSLKNFSDFALCEHEIAFMQKLGITPLFLTDKHYPQRLLNCYDSPTLLYYKGTADLNASKIAAVVGTRKNTDYGKMICEKLVHDLAGEQVIIVSGLAFGVDSIAHKAAVKNKLATVGVLAHGLDKIYPSQNKALAKEMMMHGGLLTDFMSGTNPDRQNFPARNRIAAGIADCIIVIESSKKGGSLITADLANGYNKDVFAFPGRTSDEHSEGCNHLIRTNRAQLITSADDLLHAMNWKPTEKKPKKQRELFVELTADERKLTDILGIAEAVHIDKLYLQSGLSSSAAANALLTLEMQGIVSSLPGKMYRMN